MKKLYFLIMIFAAVLTSCNDSFLDKEPLDKLTETAVFSDPDLAKSYVNALYNVIPDPFTEGSLAACTDEAYFRFGGTSTNYITRGEMTPDKVVYISEGGPAHNTRLTFLNIWKRSYTSIREMNVFIQKMDGNTAIKDEVKNQLLGEVYYLRAFTYANLIWRYGGVPIIDKIFNLGDDYYSVSRNSYDSCVKHIIADLDRAEALLSDKAEDKGRACKDACLALKSRVYLYAASPLFNDPTNPSPAGNDTIWRGTYSKEKWTLAKDAAYEMIKRADAGAYSLGKYDDVWKNENCSEIIWARWFTTTSGNKAQLYYAPATIFGGWTGCAPLENLVVDYEMAATGKKIFEEGSGYDPSNPWTGRDPRFYMSIIQHGSTYRSTDFKLGKSSDAKVLANDRFYKTEGEQCTGYGLRKWHQEDKPVTESENYTICYPWFRLAEIYLNYAEACLELGDEGTCRTYINKVRSRSGVNMPIIKESVTGDELRQALIEERRIELAFENQRFFDVRRWKLAFKYENINGYGCLVKKDATTGKYSYVVATKGSNGEADYSALKTAGRAKYTQRVFHHRFYLQPIPTNEMQKAQGVLLQNPGYDDTASDDALTE